MRSSDERTTLGQQRAEVARLPVGQPGDFELVRRADDERLVERLHAVERERQRLAPVFDELAELRKEHQRLRAELRELEGQTVRRAQVVATTLAKLAVDGHAGKRRYDHVVIDEVSAALGPHVVHAASLAGTGVTLLGDYLQNGPISSVPDHHELGPDVAPWLRQDVFAYLGLDDPERLLEARGVDTLTDQYRFGPVATELANRIAYRGVLRVAARNRSSPPDDGLGEIVLVDTTSLGELARTEYHPRGGRWWHAGALLSTAIAGRCAAAGEAVGVVTPYTAQFRLIDDLVAGTRPPTSPTPRGAVPV